MRCVQARYEDGKLLPAKPLPLRSGEQVLIFIVQRSDPARWNLARLAASAGEDEELSETGLDDWAADLDKEDQA